MSRLYQLPKVHLAALPKWFALAGILTVASQHAMAATCESLATLPIPFSTIKATSITSGTFAPPTGAAITGLPQFCRVSLVMSPTTDSVINVEVWLPATTWNGRLEGIGGGGYTGTLSYSTLASVVKAGFVAADTDEGTAPSTTLTGVAIAGHPEKYLDFGSRSTHEMTVAAKMLTLAYYAKEPDHSYWVGCSTGGQQGMTEAQVWPDDYDGIVAGAPAHNRTHAHTAVLADWVVSHKPPGAVISSAKLAMLNTAVLASCVGKDGGLPTDTFLNDPRQCSFDPSTIACPAGQDGASCLNSGELVTAQTMYDGLRNPDTNELIYPGWARGSETGWITYEGGTAYAFPGIVEWALGTSFDLNPLAFNFDTDMATVDSTLAPTVTFESTNLSRFTAHGGKILSYQGFADPIVATFDTINYFNRLASEQNLTPAQVQAFARFFLVPGMGHCSGGNGPNTFDSLTPLMNWVEQGIPPQTIVATKYVNNVVSQGVQMTRPLCLFPLLSVYSGVGDPTVAANWSCQASAAPQSSQPAAAKYVQPLVIQAQIVPNIVNMRSPAGLVTVVLTTPSTSADFNAWVPGNIKAEEASPVSANRSADGKTYVVTFNKADLVSFTGGRVPGNSVDLMITGTLQHDGLQSLFAASATIKIIR